MGGVDTPEPSSELSTTTATTPLPPGEPSADMAAAPTPRRRIDRGLVIASLAIATGLVLIGFGIARSVTGEDVTKLPPAIESISPVPDAVQVPSQTQIVVDLDTGYVGRLAIDRVSYPTVNLADFGRQDIEPGAQIDIPPGVVFEPGNATLTFTLGEEIGLDEFDPGQHTVVVVFWKLLLGEDTARSYTWTFNVV